jgi:hypothetical protein
MNYKIYVQSVDGFPISDWCASAYMGFKEKGGDVRLYEDINEVPVSKANIVVGFIEDTIEYFKNLGVVVPSAMNVPPELSKYAKRGISYVTMAELKQLTKFPIFAKPNLVAKEFVAGVIRNKADIELYLRDVPDDMPVMLSEVVDLVTEYRCYVINGKLVGIYFYLGDFRIFPDVSVIDAAILDFKSAPSAYTLDFGVTSDGQTILIEAQDAWSIGNYGLENKLYSKFLATRWLEIIK